jgi:hypothetical protein
MPASLNFFGTRSDHEAVVRFLFDSTDIRIFESYSEFGQKLREFRSFEELGAAFDVGMDPHGHGSAITLHLCSPAIEPKPRIKRISLDPSRCDGHTFRYRIEGNLIQFYLGGISGQTITISQYGHMGEAAARYWGVDWAVLKRLSNKIQYHIRNRLAVARVSSRPVLPEAAAYARSGYALKDRVASPISYELPA